jgi:hypothetical protein
MTCDECGKSFKSLDSFFQHQSSTGHLTCEECQKCFNSQQSLQQHEQSTGHQGRKRQEAAIVNEIMKPIIAAVRRQYESDQPIEAYAPNIQAAIINLKCQYKTDLLTYSIRELKRRLQETGLAKQSEACLEKSELVELLLKSAPFTFLKNNGVIVRVLMGDYSCYC